MSGKKAKTQNILDLQNKFLRKKFSLAYQKITRDFPLIPFLENREFAFFYWDKSYMIRHIGFQTLGELLETLKNNGPRHVYSSAARYTIPSLKKMDEKGWLGCDFIIDIDADHMHLPCMDEHDYYFCVDPLSKGCNHYGKGEAPEVCPECGGKKFRKQTWLCDNCLAASKTEVYKLIDFFKEDFGISDDDIHLKFSGHRGYHLTITDDRLFHLDSDSRRQIVDYLEGTNFEPKDCLIMEKGNFFGSLSKDPGWRGRVARKFHEILTNCTFDEFQAIFDDYGIDSKIIEALYRSRAYLSSKIRSYDRNWSISTIKIKKKDWKQIIKALVEQIHCNVDVPVSIDIHRLLRLAGTINGKTGFLVEPIKFEDLKDYDPFSNPLLFDIDGNTPEKRIKIKITSEFVPSIRLGSDVFGAYYKGQVETVPEAVGIFLMSKGVATIYNEL